MEYITLNSNEKMPILGTGTNTYAKENNDYYGEPTGQSPDLENAISLGYRSIDAAISYNNEPAVGKVVAESGVPREEFFITTKIPNDDKYIASKEAVRKTIDNSLKNFETDYLDLYLIHHPIENKEYFKQTWEVLEEYYKDGKVKSIGVSNFDEELLDELREFATVKPAVNQIQINLKEKNEELLKLLVKEDITPVAWGPMKATDEQKAALNKIGESYNKSGAQVLLRYQTQRNIAVIPKSHSNENQAANLDIFDFELTVDELDKISKL
jgi:diketogulonate reductase-like aldo/keto reductase